MLFRTTFVLNSCCACILGQSALRIYARQTGGARIDVSNSVTVQINSDLVAVKSGFEALDSDVRKVTSGMVRSISQLRMRMRANLNIRICRHLVFA